jgi:protein arginine kinase activator
MGRKSFLASAFEPDPGEDSREECSSATVCAGWPTISAALGALSLRRQECIAMGSLSYSGCLIMVLCQKCGKTLATTHVTMIVCGIFSEVHLCNPCYSNSAKITTGILRCDRCGFALHDIQSRGRMGCAEDYKIFSRDLAACIQGYHGAIQHVGKVPKTARRKLSNPNI